MRTIIVVLILSAAAVTAAAAPLASPDVPAPLQPWIDWVLYGETTTDCPLVYNDVSRTLCLWPSPLTLSCGEDDAEFSQTWTSYVPDTWIEIPGSSRLWPQEVTVNGQAVAVGRQQDRPAVRLSEPGTYRVQGRFIYDQRPEWMQVPAQTGLVHLAIDGKPVAFPRLEENGRLWLRRLSAASPADTPEDRLQVRVQRLVEDDIPLRLVTRLEITVSGKTRQVRLGQAATDAFIPMELSSPLPVRIDKNGMLQVQVRPGQWTIEITTRHVGPAAELSPETAGRFHDKNEIWAFAADRQLRLVTVTGPPQIDVRQTRLPDKWKQFPAYLMKPEAVMRLVIKKRGDPDPAPDQLHLDRTFWLDFDGKGYSVRDRITGSMTTGWRLAAAPPLQPGRVTVDGRERFITRLKDSGEIGVEMRYGRVDLLAESRLPAGDALPAAGWDRNFQSVQGTLNLPPGWSLLTASGLDDIQQTWLKQWSLLDLFFVLIVAVAMARLYGWYWGIIALAAMILIIHEPGAPVWLWLHLLAAVALLRVVPAGKIRTLISAYRLGCLILLIAVSLPFLVTQVRNGFYPQLERSWQTMGGVGPAKQAAAVQRFDAAAPRALQAESRPDRELLPTPAPKTAGTVDSSYRQEPALHQFDVKAKIQTGPGIPSWQWQQVDFSWNGPVAATEQISFCYLSPRINLVLALIQVVLLALLIYGFSGVRYTRGSGLKFPSYAGTTTFLLLIMLVNADFAKAQSEFPPESFLRELKSRLTAVEKPDCAPYCATSPRMRAEINEKTLTLLMEVHSLADQVAIPLPASPEQWLPQQVRLDDRPVSALYRDPQDNLVWLTVPRGVHRIHLSGILPERRSVQIPLPLKPRHVSISARDWRVDGLHDNGRADDQLQFDRIRQPGGKSEVPSRLEPGALPAFFEIRRVFHLGLSWQVETTVQRLTPPGTAAVLAFPLLEGESVTTDIPVTDGRVRLNLGPQDKQFTWASSLDPAGQLSLQAANTLSWREVWQVDIGPIWHAEFTGIPVIQHQDSRGKWLPEWRPWPGETVTIRISRPQGVAGQTFTIENSLLTVKPGQRMTHADLALTVISSRGTQHRLDLPEQSELQAVVIDGKTQPIRQEEGTVTLPLTPGKQQIQLSWRQQASMDWYWQSPPVDLQIPSVDAFTTVQMPRDRWIFYCGGPHVGPAVLFWSLVLVIALLSFGLGRISITPLRFHHWFLLGLGLTQASLLTALPVAAWFLALGYRRHINITDKVSGLTFNIIQIFLVALTAAAAAALFYGVKHGLLGYPDMQIAGNGSSAALLRWYQDIAGPVLPRALIVSLPLYVYRILILIWALWIAFACIRWLRWGWESWSTGGRWLPMRLPRIRPTGPKNKASQTGGDLPGGG